MRPRTRLLLAFSVQVVLACASESGHVGVTPDQQILGDSDGQGSGAIDLDPERCLEICGRHAAAEGRDGDGSGLLREENCLFMCAQAASGQPAWCRVAAEDFEGCLGRAAAITSVSEWDLFFERECLPVLACILPDLPATLLTRARSLSMLFVCGSYLLERGGWDQDDQAYRSDLDACLTGLQAKACSCRTEPSRHAEGSCRVTLADLHACATSGAAGEPADAALCEPFAWSVAPPSPGTRLVDLDCGQARALCQAAIPEQGTRPDYFPCHEVSPRGADYDSPVESCVVLLEGLRCSCESEPDGEGCALTAGDLGSCLANARVDGCA